MSSRSVRPRWVVVVAALAVSIAVPWSSTAAEGTVKVFILAGQSNMEGKAPNTLLDYQAEAPETKDLFKHLRKDGKWIVREDVFIKFLDRKGPLTIGYGSPGRTGAELEFGWMMGDHFDEPVVLIKAAWGGHSLFQQFCSPSQGLRDLGGSDGTHVQEVAGLDLPSSAVGQPQAAGFVTLHPLFPPSAPATRLTCERKPNASFRQHCSFRQRSKRMPPDRLSGRIAMGSRPGVRVNSASRGAGIHGQPEPDRAQDR